MDDLVQRLLDKATIVHLQPDDILLIGNAGPVDDTCTQALQQLQNLVSSPLYIFERDINVELIRDLTPCPHCSNPEGWDACPIHTNS
jgi:hypothetical protein